MHHILWEVVEARVISENKYHAASTRTMRVFSSNSNSELSTLCHVSEALGS